MKQGQYDMITDSDELYKLVTDSLEELATSHELQAHEKPRQVKLLKDPFTTENNLLTPTMKLKRNIAAQIFQKDIEYLYSIENQPKKKKGFLGLFWPISSLIIYVHLVVLKLFQY